MLYELRHYDVHGSRNLTRLTQRFSDHTLRIWNRIGIEPVGFWSVVVGQPVSRLTYLLAWDDLGHRQKIWDTFLQDPEWRETVVNSQIEHGGSLTHTITSEILLPTSFSRTPRCNNQPARFSGGLFELRTYAFQDAGHLVLTSDWFEKLGVPQLEKHGIYTMGFWTTYIGVSPRLTYMLVFESMAHRERAWASFYTDPEWTSLQDSLYPQGQPLIKDVENWLMRGTDFSGWK